MLTGHKEQVCAEPAPQEESLSDQVSLEVQAKPLCFGVSGGCTSVAFACFKSEHSFRCCYSKYLSGFTLSSCVVLFLKKHFTRTFFHLNFFVAEFYRHQIISAIIMYCHMEKNQ